jgi:Flp pilus assembly protein TadB
MTLDDANGRELNAAEKDRLRELERRLVINDPMLDQSLRRQRLPQAPGVDPVHLGIVGLVALPLTVVAALLGGIVVAALIGGVTLAVAMVVLTRSRRSSHHLPPPPAYR